MAINDYSLAAMQQIAKLISDSAAQDTASVRDSLAYMSMIHGIKMDKEKMGLAREGQISAEENQDFRNMLAMLTFGRETSFKDREMDIMESKLTIAQGTETRALAKHEQDLKASKLETITKELTLLESVRALDHKAYVDSFYNQSGLQSLYMRNARDAEKDDDLGQDEAIKELHKEWGFDPDQAQNIVSAVWDYNLTEKADPTVLGGIATKLNYSLQRVALGESSVEDDKYAQAFQTSGYIDPTDEASLNAVIQQTGDITKASQMKSLIKTEMEQAAKGEYTISPEVGMYTSKPVTEVPKVDIAEGAVPMQFEVGQTYDVQQLEDWGLDTDIKNQLSDKSFVEFALNTPTEAEVISHKPAIAPKQIDDENLRDAFSMLEKIQLKIPDQKESFQDAISELDESFHILARESGLHDFLPKSKYTTPSSKGMVGAGIVSEKLDAMSIPSEDDIRKLSSEVAKISQDPRKYLMSSRGLWDWRTPKGEDLIQSNERYIKALDVFQKSKSALDQIKRMESDARANLSRIYAQSWQP